LIHSVDSLKLLQTINREGIKNDRIIDCLLQVYIALEETKFGLSEEELFGILNSDDFKSFTNVRICGLMGMATYTEDENVVRKEFRTLKGLFNKLKSSYFSEKSYFAELSMGMSGDYKIAVEEGSTMVRIGSLIFGERY
jgi:PLP dependent protein